ncbi:hypothetical protein [Nitrosomonas ureae]|nr:hypothetical protein [Nitrosomonas ureae]
MKKRNLRFNLRMNPAIQQHGKPAMVGAGCAGIIEKTGITMHGLG